MRFWLTRDYSGWWPPLTGQSLSAFGPMGTYKLIGLDQGEASTVRRGLHLWSSADEQTVRPLILALQERGCLRTVRVSEPRWEINVYLYTTGHIGKSAVGRRTSEFLSCSHSSSRAPTF